MIKERINDPIA